MSENQQYITDTKARIKEFEEQLEPERLREAYLELEGVEPKLEKDALSKAAVRTAGFYLWLEITKLIDEHTVPIKDSDEFSPSVTPPTTSDGRNFLPGTDPKMISDPVARKQYEKDLAENDKRNTMYRMQVYLERVKEQVQVKAKRFITTNYSTSVVADQRELKAGIEKTIENRKSKEDLLSLLAPEYR